MGLAAGGLAAGGPQIQQRLLLAEKLPRQLISPQAHPYVSADAVPYISASDNDTGQVTCGGGFKSGMSNEVAASVQELVNAASYRVSLKPLSSSANAQVLFQPLLITLGRSQLVGL